MKGDFHEMMFGSFLRERHYRATGLTSARGRSLNAKQCSVIGYDESKYRLLCKFEDEKDPVLLMGKNLQPIKGLEQIAEWERRFPYKFCAEDLHYNCQVETGENFLEALAEAYESKLYLRENSIKFRLKKIKTFLIEATLGLQDEEQLFCADNGPESIVPPTFMALLKPTCMGNEEVHFKEFANHLNPRKSVLKKRFQEYVMTGMCVKCQIYINELEE